MEVPAGYKGPTLEIITKTLKPDNTAEVIEKLLSNVKEGSKVALFQKDESDGELTDLTLQALAAKDTHRVEMKDFLDKVNMTKIEPEVENLDIATRFVKWTFDNVVNEVEDIIDAEKEIKHT